MKFILSLFLALSFVLPAYGLSCYTQGSTIIWSEPNRALEVFSYAKNQDEAAVTSLIRSDVSKGQALLLPKYSLLEILEITPMTTKVRSGDFFGYIITGALLCK